MRRRMWIALALAILCASLMGFAQSMPKTGTQSVLLLLPERFHDEELVHVLQQFVDREADIYITSLNATSTAGVDALKARVPERFFNLQPGLSGGPQVTVIPSFMSFEFKYDKTVSLGAGWYDEYFTPSGFKGPEDPSFSRGLYWFLGRQVSDHGVVGAIGAGVYPVIFSGILPQGSTVPAYPCPDLVTAISDQGYTPKQASTEPRSDDIAAPPLVPIVTGQDTDGCFLIEQPVNGSTVVMTPIPNSWYPTDDGLGPVLISDYADGYINAIDAVENAFAGVGGVSAVQISHLDCGPDGMVTLRNAGEDAVNLAGWTLRSVDPQTGEVLHEYTFAEYTLAPGDAVHVYSGMMMWSGPANYLHWEEGVLFAENGRAELLDPQGNRRSVRDCDKVE